MTQYDSNTERTLGTDQLFHIGELVRNRPEEALRQIYSTQNPSKLVATLFVAHYRDTKQYGATARQIYLDLSGDRVAFERSVSSYDGIEARPPTHEERINPIIEKMHRTTCGGRPGIPVNRKHVSDPDANGWLSNAIRCLED